MIVYINTASYAEHVALIKGDISSDDPVLVRMHGMNIMTDVLGENKAEKGAQALKFSLPCRLLPTTKVAVLLSCCVNYLTTLTDLLKIRIVRNKYRQNMIRSYGVGAQILLDLGINEMTLLSNTQRPVVGLDGYGLTITGYRAITASDLS